MTNTYQPMGYMDNLEHVALAGVELIHRKTETYGDSWKRRGGAGAWFTTVRPWDRLEGIVARHEGNVLAAIAADLTGADGSALACVRDIRNYLTLIEAEALSLAQSGGKDMPLADGTRVLSDGEGPRAVFARPDSILPVATPVTSLSSTQDHTPDSDRPALPPGSPERRRALEGLPVLLQNALIVAGLGDARITQLPGDGGQVMRGCVVLEITIDVR